MINKKLKIILILIIGIIIGSCISVYATYNYFASDVKYKKEDGTEISVETALNELYNFNKNISINKGTGEFSEQNYFSINNLGYKPSEIWLIAKKPSISGKLVVHATKDGAEYWATAGKQNYYAIEKNLNITDDGFNYTATGWSDAIVNWIALK